MVTTTYYADRDVFFQFFTSQFHRRAVETPALQSPPNLIVISAMNFQSALNPVVHQQTPIPAAFGRPFIHDMGQHVGAKSLTNDLLVLGARVSVIAEELHIFWRQYSHDSASNLTYQMSSILFNLKNAIYKVHDAVLLEPESYTKIFKRDLNKMNNGLRSHLNKVAEKIQYIWSIDEVSKVFAVQSLFEGDQFVETIKYMEASKTQLTLMRMVLNEVTYTAEETPIIHYFGITSRSLEERTASLQTAFNEHQTALNEYVRGRQAMNEEDCIDQAGQGESIKTLREQQSPFLDLEFDLVAFRNRWIKPTAIEDEDLTILPCPPTRVCTNSTSSSGIIEWLTNQDARYLPPDMAPVQPDNGSIKHEDQKETEQEVETKHAEAMDQNKEAKSPLRRAREGFRNSTGGRILVNVIHNLAVHGMLGSKNKRKYARLL